MPNRNLCKGLTKGCTYGIWHRVVCMLSLVSCRNTVKKSRVTRGKSHHCCKDSSVQRLRKSAAKKWNEECSVHVKNKARRRPSCSKHHTLDVYAYSTCSVCVCVWRAYVERMVSELHRRPPNMGAAAENPRPSAWLLHVLYIRSPIQHHRPTYNYDAALSPTSFFTSHRWPLRRKPTS